MLSTFAWVLVLTAMIAFFTDEVLAFIKKLHKKPWLFWTVILVVASLWAEIYARELLWFLVSYHIVLLEIVAWVSERMDLPGINLAVWQFLWSLFLGGVPLLIGSLLNWRNRTETLMTPIAQRVALTLWLITLLLFVVGVPN